MSVHGILVAARKTKLTLAEDCRPQSVGPSASCHYIRPFTFTTFPHCVAGDCCTETEADVMTASSAARHASIGAQACSPLAQISGIGQESSPGYLVCSLKIQILEAARSSRGNATSVEKQKSLSRVVIRNAAGTWYTAKIVAPSALCHRKYLGWCIMPREVMHLIPWKRQRCTESRAVGWGSARG
ncbi:hypothetical protein BGZ61DRAFT_103628 [Ilyonectria robusta]|uniref:uncharacterized protein n=1 Tax=Ilyonectria robusta TaxID=1079257 RepID=UPI001E8CDC21|nr:uncharacterized protein BGZ61DRAFT_103628 [Ilyonectria robusta]KAH8673118.1 hypothetical protein BGZ61DRAFT_103628 [Ilyonectria robusta]